MRNGCVAVALVLLGATGVRADRVLTFSLPNALLLFGDYNQLRVVTARGEQVLHPAVDEGYNRGYFALPSISARQDGVIAWGFAVGWDETRRHDKARFALGLYSRANQQWRTYGNFDRIGDAGISSDGTKVAFVAREPGRMTLQILNVATGALTERPYQPGMWPRGTPSWSLISLTLLYKCTAPTRRRSWRRWTSERVSCARSATGSSLGGHLTVGGSPSTRVDAAWWSTLMEAARRSRWR